MSAVNHTSSSYFLYILKYQNTKNKAPKTCLGDKLPNEKKMETFFILN